MMLKSLLIAMAVAALVVNGKDAHKWNKRASNDEDGELDDDDDDNEASEHDPSRAASSSMQLLHEFLKGPVLEREPLDVQVPLGPPPPPPVAGGGGGGGGHYRVGGEDYAITCAARNALSMRVRCSLTDPRVPAKSSHLLDQKQPQQQQQQQLRKQQLVQLQQKQQVAGIEAAVVAAGKPNASASAKASDAGSGVVSSKDGAQGLAAALVVPSTTLVDLVDPMTGVRHIEIRAPMNLDVLKMFSPLSPPATTTTTTTASSSKGDSAPSLQLFCACHAWSSRGGVRSRVASVKFIADSSKRKESPQRRLIPLGEKVVLECPLDARVSNGAARGGHGDDRPSVFWLWNGAEMLEDDNVEMDAHSATLTIRRAGLNNEGRYTCGVRHPVGDGLSPGTAAGSGAGGSGRGASGKGERLGETVIIQIKSDGSWSTWGSWSECPARCGRGQRSRTRSCTNPPARNGGRDCPGDYVQRGDCFARRNCTTPASAVASGTPASSASAGVAVGVGVDMGATGVWSTWSAWSECGVDCRQHRQRWCRFSPAPGGAPVATSGVGGLGPVCPPGRDHMSVDCSGPRCVSPPPPPPPPPPTGTVAAAAGASAATRDRGRVFGGGGINSGSSSGSNNFVQERSGPSPHEQSFMAASLGNIQAIAMVIGMALAAVILAFTFLIALRFWPRDVAPQRDKQRQQAGVRSQLGGPDAYTAVAVNGMAALSADLTSSLDRDIRLQELLAEQKLDAGVTIPLLQQLYQPSATVANGIAHAAALGPMQPPPPPATSSSALIGGGGGVCGNAPTPAGATTPSMQQQQRQQRLLLAATARFVDRSRTSTSSSTTGGGGGGGGRVVGNVAQRSVDSASLATDDASLSPRYGPRSGSASDCDLIYDTIPDCCYYEGSDAAAVTARGVGGGSHRSYADSSNANSSTLASSSGAGSGGSPLPPLPASLLLGCWQREAAVAGSRTNTDGGGGGGGGSESAFTAPWDARPLARDAIAWSAIGPEGGRVSLDRLGVWLTVPAGAVRRGRIEFYVAVLPFTSSAGNAMLRAAKAATATATNDATREGDDDVSGALAVCSATVQCGPADANLARPAIVSFDHCAHEPNDRWSLCLLAADEMTAGCEESDDHVDNAGDADAKDNIRLERVRALLPPSLPLPPTSTSSPHQHQHHQQQFGRQQLPSVVADGTSTTSMSATATSWSLVCTAGRCPDAAAAEDAWPFGADYPLATAAAAATPLCHVDPHTCHVQISQLGRLALCGRSAGRAPAAATSATVAGSAAAAAAAGVSSTSSPPAPGVAAKRVRLMAELSLPGSEPCGAWGPPHHAERTLRLYAVPDTRSAVETLNAAAACRGGWTPATVASPATNASGTDDGRATFFLVHDNGCNLAFSLDELSLPVGWSLKSSSLQEISFGRVWATPDDAAPFVQFTLLTSSTGAITTPASTTWPLDCRVAVCQGGDSTRRQLLAISSESGGGTGGPSGGRRPLADAAGGSGPIYRNVADAIAAPLHPLTRGSPFPPALASFAAPAASATLASAAATTATRGSGATVGGAAADCAAGRGRQTDRGVLTAEIRNRLCLLLDARRDDGADWRRLAEHMGLGR